MNVFPDWLPALILSDEFEGDWERYQEALYQVFKVDFLGTRPMVLGKRLGLKRYPMFLGKEATFWHFISETGQEEGEENRKPDLMRCERLRWIRCMIEAIGSNRVCSWRNKRGDKKRLVVALLGFSYVVILDEREDYFLPWTAYSVRPHSREKLRKEYNEFIKKAGPAT